MSRVIPPPIPAAANDVATQSLALRALQPPPFFAGNQQETAMFLSQMRMFLTATRTTEHRERCALTLSRLQGSALQWALPAFDDPTHRFWSDSDALLDGLAEAFKDELRQRRANTSLVDLARLQSVPAIIAEVRRLRRETNLGEDTIKHFVSAALPDIIGDFLDADFETLTLDQYLVRAERLDQRLAIRHARSSTRVNSGSNRQQRSSAPASSQLQQQQQQAQQQAPRSGPRDPITPEERERRRINRLCFRCAGAGHTANICPLRNLSSPPTQQPRLPAITGTAAAALDTVAADLSSSAALQGKETPIVTRQ